MSTVHEIETAIERLDEESLGKLSGWFEEFLAEKWERRFEVDARVGKLDALGEAADRAFERGECRPL
jgi:hypothetical protein